MFISRCLNVIIIMCFFALFQARIQDKQRRLRQPYILRPSAQIPSDILFCPQIFYFDLWLVKKADFPSFVLIDILCCAVSILMSIFLNKGFLVHYFACLLIECIISTLLRMSIIVCSLYLLLISFRSWKGFCGVSRFQGTTCIVCNSK